MDRFPILPGPMTRRDVIKGVLGAGAVGVVGRASSARGSQSPVRPQRSAVGDYVRRHARADGGFAFGDQDRSHLTPTFAAVGILHLLHESPADAAALAAYVRTHHPRELKKLEQEHREFDFQQVQALAWLGEAAADLRDRIAAIRTPVAYLEQYERHGYPVFQGEMGIVRCYALLGLPLDRLTPAFTDYIAARCRANGSYNNTPAADGGDGHVVNTLWAFGALEALGRPLEHRNEAIAWLRACQRPTGGFTFQPDPSCGGADDVAYTQAAVRSLRMLGSEPERREACVAWLLSLATADGGCADRPGWESNLVATYRALDALDALDALHGVPEITRSPAPHRAALADGLKIFSIQIEAHGAGSPAEAVALAGALRIDLWGAKNPEPGWLERVRGVAAARGVPVLFFTANEEYGTWIDVPGLGTYSHMSDLVAPPTGTFGTSVANQGAMSWDVFRERRLAPLERGRGRLIWQFGENEQLVKMLLDDSIERGGFAAISTFHFGNPDFFNTEPFLQRWRGQIPYIALQDAHGAEPWWFSDMTTGFRTLFLAAEPTWEGWLHALDRNWVVAVRHDAVSRNETWMHGGSAEVLDFVRAREAAWRWWEPAAVSRPLLSLVALTPADTFEAARPESGVALRVRCAWTNTGQGLPATPLAELVRLDLDDTVVEPVLVTRPRPNGSGLVDHYHVLALPALPAGRHEATAVAREMATGREVRQTIAFSRSGQVVA
jgi:hypothetical protein